MNLTNSILLIDKPPGITSFDCIRILRRKLGIRKMGHAGTLDPMATGLMIIGVGEGTKKLHEFLKLPKTYEVEILLGVKTDTGDVTGRELPISSDQFPNNDSIFKISHEKVNKTLQGMVGKLELPVPAYSAIKQGGEALYKKARRGEFVDVPVKTMEINSVEFLEVEPQVGKEVQPVENHRLIGKARFTVTSGTYIRSLAEEFGRRLGVPATLAGLRRTRIGEFKVESAEPLIQ
ncbi:MAG: tRNA pseudouridine(55) synthase TruB [Patescibacteria group bacterium]